MKYEWCATWIIPRGAFSIHVSYWALTGASVETRIRECAALYLSATAPPSSNERVGQGKTEDAPLEMPPSGGRSKLWWQKGLVMAVKHIMVLSGVADSGKTNTLNMLAEKLYAMHHSLLWVGSPLRQNKTILPTINPSMPNGNGWKDDDHWYCFDVSTKSNGHRIVAISTQGDNYEVCRKALDAFNVASLCPEVVVLASRSSWSESVEAIETWNRNIMPSYTAIMIEPKTKQKTAVEKAIVDRLYNEIV